MHNPRLTLPQFTIVGKFQDNCLCLLGIFSIATGQVFDPNLAGANNVCTRTHIIVSARIMLPPHSGIRMSGQVLRSCSLLGSLWIGCTTYGWYASSSSLFFYGSLRHAITIVTAEHQNKL